MSFKPVKHAVADSSQKASSATDQEGLHFYVGSNFHRPPSEMQVFFIYFHQGPPRTIWQGPRRTLHKWPLLKSAPQWRPNWWMGPGARRTDGHPAIWSSLVGPKGRGPWCTAPLAPPVWPPLLPLEARVKIDGQQCRALALNSVSFAGFILTCV